MNAVGFWRKSQLLLLLVWLLCDRVWLQKRKDDLKINNYFSLVCNELELSMLRKKEEDN